MEKMNQNEIGIIKNCSKRGRKEEKRDEKEMKLNSVKRKEKELDGIENMKIQVNRNDCKESQRERERKRQRQIEE